MTWSAPQSSQPWRILPLVLLAVALGAVMAWAIRGRAADLDAGVGSLLLQPIGAGHHDGSGGASPPPPILREGAANYFGITLLAAHLTFGGLLISGAIAHRQTRAGRIGTPLAFAAISALLAGLATVPVAALSVGNAISFSNTLAAAVTVLQYSFALSLIVTILVDLRLRVPNPGR